MRPSLHRLALGLVLVGAGTAAAAQEATRMSTVPFAAVRSGGQVRPVVTAKFNGRPMRMMIHSQATFVVQLKHAQARRFGITDLRRKGSYGIDRPGHVSALGSSTGMIARMTVGESENRAVPVSVFEVPQDDLGMLGVEWIRRNRVVLDYAARRATIAPTPAAGAALRARLLRAGYTAVPMTFADSRYRVDATIGGVRRRMVVASASSTALDPAFAAAGGVQKGAVVSTGSGPTGASVPFYAAASPVNVGLGRWTSPPLREVSIEDAYAYMGEARPDDAATAAGGSLGSEFLAATAAIVDFGNLTLYVR